MEQKDKELLLKDLCSRLPYGVKIKTPSDCWTNETTIAEFREIFKGDDGLFRIGDIGALIEYSKPYLFPISSMTEEQKREYQYITERWMYDAEYSIGDSIDWLNAHHFDYRGLIEKGLAIDATGLGVYEK